MIHDASNIWRKLYFYGKTIFAILNKLLYAIPNKLLYFYAHGTQFFTHKSWFSPVKPYRSVLITYDRCNCNFQAEDFELKFHFITAKNINLSIM